MNKVSTGTIVALALVCIIGFTVVTMVGSYFTYNNQEIDLRQQCEAQRGKVEGVHDAMWKIISQKAQVSQEYRAGFDSIYTHIIEGRYSQGDGSLMKWIQEANPQFDTSLYKDVMDAIEQQRTIFRKAHESAAESGEPARLLQSGRAGDADCALHNRYAGRRRISEARYGKPLRRYFV